jgi:hypothetical protein
MSRRQLGSSLPLSALGGVGSQVFHSRRRRIRREERESVRRHGWMGQVTSVELFVNSGSTTMTDIRAERCDEKSS